MVALQVNTLCGRNYSVGKSEAVLLHGFYYYAITN